MMLPDKILQNGEHWLSEQAPASHVVVASRARYARNLARHPFAPHTEPEVLTRVRDVISDAVKTNEYFTDSFRLDLSSMESEERAYLKERRLISKEMERGGEARLVYLLKDGKTSVMVNEEDHLRLQCLEPGLQIQKTRARADEIDAELSKIVAYAWHDKLGYLTACPTNVGTGLRASVMMHLPGLVVSKDVKSALEGLDERGLTVRGFYGENTEFLGDFYQISNEVTLGMSVEEIFDNLAVTVRHLVEREEETRGSLFKRDPLSVDDAIWRSYGIITNARKINTGEAMLLLSRMRLGIDRGYFPHVTHEQLNRLFMEIQPAHLTVGESGVEEEPERDRIRAELIRKTIEGEKP